MTVNVVLLPNPIGITLLWQQTFLFETLIGATRNERDLTDWATTFRLRDSTGAVRATVTQTASSVGSIVNGGASGSLLVSLRAETTGRLTAGRFTFEIDGVFTTGQPERLIDGYVQVRAAQGLVVSSATTLVTRLENALLVEDGRAVDVIKVERGIPGPAGVAGADGASAAISAIKDPVTTIVTSDIALSGLGTHNGYTLLDGDRVLPVEQNDPRENRPYLAHAGAWEPTADVPDAATILGGVTITVSGGNFAGSTIQLDGTEEFTVAFDDLNWTVKYSFETTLAQALSMLHVNSSGLPGVSDVRMEDTAAAVGDLLVGESFGGGATGYAPLAVGTVSQVLMSNGTTLVYGLVVNAGVATGAAIAGDKIAPDFGSQTITTTGNLLLGATARATVGLIRVGNGTVILAALNGSAVNIPLVQTIGDNVQIGSSANAVTTIDSGTSGGVHLDSGGVSRFTINNSGAVFSVSSMAFSAAAGSYTISQVNGTNAGNAIIRAKGTTGVNTAGDLLLQPGFSVSGTHGKVKLQGNVDDTTPVDGVTVTAVSGVARVGLYSATPVVQAARAGQLTDSTGGTPSGTIPDAGAIYTQATVNNIVASLVQRINALETIIHNIGMSA